MSYLTYNFRAVSQEALPLQIIMYCSRHEIYLHFLPCLNFDIAQVFDVIFSWKTQRSIYPLNTMNANDMDV